MCEKEYSFLVCVGLIISGQNVEIVQSLFFLGYDNIVYTGTIKASAHDLEALVKSNQAWIKFLSNACHTQHKQLVYRI